MSSKIVRPAKGIQRREVIKGFDAGKLQAPFILRCGALIIDYIVVIIVPVGGLLLGRFLQYDGAKLLNSEISNASWLITILLGLSNFIILPMFGGQTIGKMLTGLRIVKLDGSMPGLVSICLRHLVGYPLTLLTGMLGFLISLFNKNGRTLHDFISGTVVVYGSARRSFRTSIRKKGRKVDGSKIKKSMA